MLGLIERIVAPGGELWLAEPGRTPAENLVKAIRKRGWPGKSEDFDSPRPDPHYHGEMETVTVHPATPAIRPVLVRRRPNVEHSGLLHRPNLAGYPRMLTRLGLREWVYAMRRERMLRLHR